MLYKFRKRKILREIKELQQQREKILLEKQRLLKNLKNNFEKKHNVIIDFKDSFNEPFGWKRGTVRGIITLWVTLTTCILALFQLIPLDWWLWLAGIVITSYFVSRVSMSNYN